MQSKPGGRQRRGGPHPVDIHVGMRLRQRRTALGMSQHELAAALGIAYQQLYKYEQAKNRISASRLYELSELLDVPVTFFFEGIAGTHAKAREPKRRKLNFPKER
jgi:transcriptional regulator with XRE-family HTH domain